MYINVIIDNPASQVDQTFTYHSDYFVLPGMRVKVPFGKGNNPKLGIVLSINEKVDTSLVFKDVIEVLDTEPILDDVDLKVTKLIKSHAICPTSRIFNMMIPYSKRLKQIKYLKIINSLDIDANLLALFNGELVVPYTTKFKDYEKIIKKLVSNGSIQIVQDAIERETKKYNKTLELIDYDYFPTTTRRMEVVEYLKEFGKTDEEELIEALGITVSVINKLIELNVIKRTCTKASFKVKKIINSSFLEKNVLNDDLINQTLNDKIKLFIPKSIEESNSFLLRVIVENKKINQNTLILVPDILEGYYISSFIIKNLDVAVCNLNTNINDSELNEYFFEIKENKYNVIVSTPAYFLWSYKYVSTIIVLDEESHNYSFDQSPRINVKEIIEEIILNKLTNKQIRLIYTSFSPSIEAYTNVVKYKYQLMESNNNVNESKINVVNMAKVLKQMESFIISNALKDSIDLALKDDKKVLLVINNRQYAKSIVCRNCGKTYICPKCNVPLQYNIKKKELKCPVCFSTLKEVKCSYCSSSEALFDGLGMQRVEEKLDELGYRYATLDNPKFLSLEEILEKLDNNDIDIVIASSTYAKALKDANIGLVAFIDFDAILNQYCYDASSLALSVLQNMKAISENVVIQTYDPNHFVIKYFVLNDYESFYDEEIRNRTILKVSPLYYVDRILVKAEFKEMFRISSNIKNVLLKLSKEIIVIGPSYNYKEQKVQMIVKHNMDNINNVYTRIYEMYQDTQNVIIFDRVSKSFG